MEHTVITLGREDEVVLAVLLNDIVIPHLLLGPLHVLHVENHTVVGSVIVLNIVPRQHVVVLHLEVATVIVETFAGIPVMTGVDIQASVEHIGRGVCHIIAWKQVTR